jgi:lipopolysaccharide export system permease protein
MTRIDWIVLKRFTARLAITFVIFLGLFCLVESLNSSKMQALTLLGGPGLAVLGIVLSGLWSSIGALPVTVLIGTVAGVIDLQLRRELTVMQSSGQSIWRLFRAPLILVLVFAGAISIFGETTIISFNRSFLGQPANKGGATWIEQSGSDGDYVMHVQRATTTPPAIYGVEVYLAGLPSRDRIEAETAELREGTWYFPSATRYRPDVPARHLNKFSLSTGMSFGDLRLLASGTVDLTLPELLAAATADVRQDKARAETLTSLYRTFARPLMVIGSMLIGIAAAAGYRRNVRYGDTVLFAIVCGFVLFTVNEMAIRAGNSGVLAPILATAGPALVSLLVGITALLYSQDGKI